MFKLIVFSLIKLFRLIIGVISMLLINELKIEESIKKIIIILKINIILILKTYFIDKENISLEANVTT